MYKKCEEILNKLESEGKIKISDYQFPQPQELKLKLKDMLEDKVDEKYYLGDKQTNVAILENKLPGAYGRNFGSKGKIENEICSTLQAAMGSGGGNIPLTKEIKSEAMARIRKLTPKECWRLMGFDDEDFEKASKVNSNTQLYKQAGNSIVVNVLEAIFDNLLQEYK